MKSLSLAARLAPPIIVKNWYQVYFAINISEEGWEKRLIFAPNSLCSPKTCSVCTFTFQVAGRIKCLTPAAAHSEMDKQDAKFFKVVLHAPCAMCHCAFVMMTSQLQSHVICMIFGNCKLYGPNASSRLYFMSRVMWRLYINSCKIPGA